MFEKVDGTNLHWDWDRDFGWHAYGTRRDVFNLPEDISGFESAHANLGGAGALFLETLASPLAVILTDLAKSAMVFTEFLGPGSFAGSHRPEDPKSLVIFDVMLDGQMLGPARFLQLFGHLPIPRVLYRGKFRGEILEDVYSGRYDLAEGVVVKGGEGPGLWMAKVKTRAYQERLKARFGTDWDQYWE